MGVKEKVKQIRQHRNRTGGGPSSNILLSEYEQRIQSICGNLMDGDVNLEEIGIAKSGCSSNQNNENKENDQINNIDVDETRHGSVNYFKFK